MPEQHRAKADVIADHKLEEPIAGTGVLIASTQPASATLADEEERVLRCLGAALFMQWNTLPRKLQKELFDNAGAVGALLDAGALRGQIARFLHKHKDDGMVFGAFDRDAVEFLVLAPPVGIQVAACQQAALARWDNDGGAATPPS